MMILILGGTEDGIIIGQALETLGYSVRVSAKSQYGRSIISKNGLTPCPTGLDISSGNMAEKLLSMGVGLVIDASHPFSTGVTKAAIEACRAVGIPIIRFERPAGSIPDRDNIHRVDGFQDAASMTRRLITSKRAFLAIGSKNLNWFTEQVDPAQLVVRVLPVASSLATCWELGVSPKQIVAIQGPVSHSLNKALFENYEASLLVTKESGEQGGLQNKLRAALELNMEIIVINRPGSPDDSAVQTLSDMDALIAVIRSGFYG